MKNRKRQSEFKFEKLINENCVTFLTLTCIDMINETFVIFWQQNEYPFDRNKESKKIKSL